MALVCECGFSTSCEGCQYCHRYCLLTGEDIDGRPDPLSVSKLCMDLSVVNQKQQELIEALLDKLSIYETTSIYEARLKTINNLLEN